MDKTISVYFSGSGFPINDQGFLAGWLHERTDTSESQIKIGFNGCGIDYGINGIIFGSGLDKQCDHVIEQVVQEINAGHNITLNVYGHSRGGVAALMLAKQLSNIDEQQLAINLAMLDPVPGNLITTANIDPLMISLANKTSDLSHCKPLKKVLVLYPCVPLYSIECHAPLLASYPQDTVVEEEVVAGCHAHAEQQSQKIFSRLVRYRVAEFLVNNGTKLQLNGNHHDVAGTKDTYLAYYNQQLALVDKPSVRKTHSAQGMVINAAPGAKYLNSRHKALAGDSSKASVCLSIEPEKGIFSWFKRFFTHHPLIGQAVKWGLIALLATTLLYFTGGLAAIPLLVPVTVKLGAFSLFVFSPIIGSALAAIWYGIVKPALSWGAGKFFYPHYLMRKIETPCDNISNSTRIIINNLAINRSLSANSPSVELPPYQAKSPLCTAKENKNNYSEIINQQRLSR